MSAPPLAAAQPEAAPRRAAPRVAAPTRPYYWSVRRELWENRFIYLAPLGVAAFAVVGLVIHGITMPSHLPGMLAADPATPGSAPVTYRVAATLMLLTAFITGAFYCLEALNSERRDRSILFWKSLPVSDRTTVLAKAVLPLVILPAVTFVVIVAMQAVMLLLSAVVLLAQGGSPAALWREVAPLRLWPAVLYAVAAMALWHAPIYAFLLMVSGWARRTAALWAVLPVLALVALEKLAMNGSSVWEVVKYRLFGWYLEGFTARASDHLPFHPQQALTAERLLGAPALWLGLAFAVACLAVAVRLRRHREPI